MKSEVEKRISRDKKAIKDYLRYVPYTEGLNILEAAIVQLLKRKTVKE